MQPQHELSPPGMKGSLTAFLCTQGIIQESFPYLEHIKGDNLEIAEPVKTPWFPSSASIFTLKEGENKGQLVFYKNGSQLLIKSEQYELAGFMHLLTSDVCLSYKFVGILLEKKKVYFLYEM